MLQGGEGGFLLGALLRGAAATADLLAMHDDHAVEDRRMHGAASAGDGIDGRDVRDGLHVIVEGALGVLAGGQGKGALPQVESILPRVVNIPWFKHFDKEAIEEYAAAFHKVAENIDEIK